MQGILLVDKPASWTSFDVVNYIRKIVATVENKKTKNVKVGHAGTLDPFASGLLIVLVGKEFTKRAGEFMKLDKSYLFTSKLGQSSTTGDPEGEISDSSSLRPTNIDITNTLKEFLGDQQQIPPSYSAIKINGRRSYQLAREGKSVEHEPRSIKISNIELKNYSYPDLTLLALVSSGTYIRTLSEDIAKRLGITAYTSELRRLSIGNYKIEDALDLKSLSVGNIEKLVIDK
jgi:tRNA pseudouridine55 synthase